MDYKVVFTNGCFDILHHGHIQVLRAAKMLGDELHVGLNSDASIKRLKGPERPIISQYDRFEMLTAIKYVDFVHIFDEDTPLELIKRINPDIVVKGGDWGVNEVVAGDRAQVVTIPLVEGLSTTKIVEKIKGMK